MKAALDANILVYAEGANDLKRQEIALQLVQALPAMRTVVPAQVLEELFFALTRKANFKPERARNAVTFWGETFSVQPTTFAVLIAAMELAVDHRHGIWDAIVLASAAEAECRVLITEDLNPGFTWRGLTVVNPFAAEPHPLLAEILRPA